MFEPTVGPHDVNGELPRVLVDPGRQLAERKPQGFDVPLVLVGPVEEVAGGRVLLVTGTGAVVVPELAERHVEGCLLLDWRLLEIGLRS
jgi:hypothetical protein